MLVAVAIGMGMTLAITLMLMRNESGRRALTSVNDASMGGAYASYVLDRSLRSAGTGFSQSWRATYGCVLGAKRSGSAVLPRSAAFPAPFAALPTTVRLAPAVVFAGAGASGSDVIATAAGSSGLSEAAMRITQGTATADSVQLGATVGLRDGDLVLVFEDTSSCMVQQVDVGFAGGASSNLPFGGAFASATVNGVNLQDMGVGPMAWVAPIGNLNGNRPQFQLLGVDANSNLVSYDVLRLDGVDTNTPLADGVADLRVLYGVDTDDDGVVDAWQSPTAAPWDAATLLNGSTASQLNLGRIRSLRVGLLMRNSAPERTAVSPATMALFADLGAPLTITRNLSASEQLLRWRALDFTVPLRNVMLPRP